MAMHATADLNFAESQVYTVYIFSEEFFFNDGHKSLKEKEYTKTDVDAHKKKKTAESNQHLVKLEMAKALSNNTKFFFSGKTSVLGGLLSNIMSN